MNRIQVKILDYTSITQAENLMIEAARLTQHGYDVYSIADYESKIAAGFPESSKSNYRDEMLFRFTTLPHATLQKFAMIPVVVIGGSRRWLAQITRHQNDVKFMSSSLHYSDLKWMEEHARLCPDRYFVTPYSLLGSLRGDERNTYYASCVQALATYNTLAEKTADTDGAAFATPQGLRNNLIISATPFQWRWMIQQRCCRRSSMETRFIMLKIWELLYEASPMFRTDIGPACMRSSIHKCNEPTHMHCGVRPKQLHPADWLKEEFPLALHTAEPHDCTCNCIKDGEQQCKLTT